MRVRERLFREKEEKMFEVGEIVVHPMHGAGVVDGIEEAKVDGVVRSYYVFKLPVGGLSMKIPVDHSEEIGMRRLITPEQADRLLAAIGGLEIEMTSNWNRRYRENMLRIKSGDLLEVARVVKGLMARDGERGLSTGERKMLRSARQILISEIVMTKNADYDEVEQQLNQALAG